MGAVLVDALIPLLAEATASPSAACHYGLWVGWGDLHTGSHAVLRAPGPGHGDAEPVRPAAARAVTDFVGACAVQPWWGGRDMLLFDGALEAVTAVGSASPFDGSLQRRGPQWWWPDDRSWFVATEIDDPWTYVAGPAPLVDAVLAQPAIEAVPVHDTDGW